MGYEREIQEKARLETKSTAKRKAGVASNRKSFEGLVEKDFSRKFSGTTWRRRRDGLGGAVSVSSESDVHEIKSWAVSRKPMIHWANVQHHNLKGSSSQANFFAAIDETALTFGFAIERFAAAQDTESDWNAFVTWLLDSENETWLKKTVGEQNLSVYIHSDKAALPDTILAENGRWRLDGKEGPEEFESLRNFLEGLPAESRVDLQIAQRIPKEDVIARKTEIAKDVGQVFEMLMPLYEASAVF
jgi:hypothetical protein